MRWRSAVHKALSYLRIGVASPFIVVGAFLTLCGYAVTFVAELISGIDL